MGLREFPHTMNENDYQPPQGRTKGRLFAVVKPSPEDFVRAAKIPTHECPRRYCWWWRSLSFDWELTPLQGCTFLASPKSPNLKNVDVPCCRCEPSSTVDHYESREPHLLKDGFPIPRWHSPQQQWPNGEISYDLVMDDDMAFCEGCYRIGGGVWDVAIFSKRPIETYSWQAGTWKSGVSGIVVLVPLTMRLNMTTIEGLLSGILGVGTWERVRGPDSMELR